MCNLHLGRATILNKTTLKAWYIQAANQMYLNVELFTIVYTRYAMYDIFQNVRVHKDTILNKVISQFNLISFCHGAHQILQFVMLQRRHILKFQANNLCPRPAFGYKDQKFFKHLPRGPDTSWLAKADLFIFAFIYCFLPYFYYLMKITRYQVSFTWGPDRGLIHQ